MKNTSLKLEAPWDEVKEKLKENDITLTDDDLQYTPGDEDALLGHLARKMGKSEDEVKGYIESVSSNKGKAS
jgi:uncharacterized protein YjbJ (UPF0337 family)